LRYRQYGEPVLKADGLQHARDFGRCGMKGFKPDEGTACIVQTRGRVIFATPFNERGRHSVEREAAIRGDGDFPMQHATAHRFDIAQNRRRRGRRGPNIVGSTYPRCQPRCGVRAFPIELEPARAIGTRRGGIDRNDFQIHGIAEPQQAIVRPHALMCSPFLGRNSERVADVFHAGFQRRRRDDYVVDL